MVYNPAGKLNYKLVAEDAKYYTAGELSWFTQPVMTLFDENAVATWSVRADRAKLTKDRMLYLYGHVEVNSLTTTSQLEKIKTDNAQVNWSPGTSPPMTKSRFTGPILPLTA